MNIGIQEADHFEGIYPVIRLFDDGINHLYLFVPRSTYVRLLDLLNEDGKRITWIIQEPDESTYSFCKKIKNAVDFHQISLLYLNTISKHHLIYAWLLVKLKQLPVILTVHDVNCLFFPKFSLHPRMFLQFIGKKWLVSKVRYFNTVSTTVQPYLQKCAGNEKKVSTIPGAVFERQQHRLPSSPIMSIVVPGTIDKKRRDYEAVFNFLDRTRELPIHLTILGGGSDEFAGEVKNKCRRYADKLTWFDVEIVHQELFDKYMDQAHFVWIPSVIQTQICGSIPEVYGITKSSGNIFDIIKHAKPFLFPEALTIPENLRSSGLSYQSLEDLIRQLQNYLKDPHLYTQIERKAELNSTAYTIEQIRLDNYPLFEGRILNNSI